MLIKTRFLILSDTHGKNFGSHNQPLQHADVVIHCGDLTDESKLEEFQTAIELLLKLDAPLKLVIAGNHDFTMDFAAFQRKVEEASPPLDADLVVREYGAPGDAKQLIERAKDGGIKFLEEGTHSFTLGNGAQLTVFASAFTPALGAWGFQYSPDSGHDFPVQPQTDIVMTHGPPKGIMDYTYGRERAGCPNLFKAIAESRPQIHCFGHIHEGWGAKLVTWRDTHGVDPTHFTAIDNDRSPTLEKLTSLEPSKFDSPDDIIQKKEKVERYTRDRCCVTSHCAGDEYPIKLREQTLFVNASICGDDHLLSQKPWIVDIELPAAVVK